MSSETSRSGTDADTADGDEATETDGYVHRPGEMEAADREADEPTTADSEASTGPYTGKADGDGFGTQGWLLVAGVVVCFLVIPGFIYLNPTAPAQIGWTFFATFLVLPLIPAVLLGLLAVWSMQAAA